MDESIYKSHLDRIIKSSDHDKLMEYDKWIPLIPFIPFKSSWLVKPIPPFGWMICRFHITRTNSKWEMKFASVYLDCYDMWAIMNKPYWEVYGNWDISRCDMIDVDELVKLISKHLK